MPRCLTPSPKAAKVTPVTGSGPAIWLRLPSPRAWLLLRCSLEVTGKASMCQPLKATHAVALENKMCTHRCAPGPKPSAAMRRSIQALSRRSPRYLWSTVPESRSVAASLQKTTLPRALGCQSLSSDPSDVPASPAVAALHSFYLLASSSSVAFCLSICSCVCPCLHSQYSSVDSL